MKHRLAQLNGPNYACLFVKPPLPNKPRPIMRMKGPGMKGPNEGLLGRGGLTNTTHKPAVLAYLSPRIGKLTYLFVRG